MEDKDIERSRSKNRPSQYINHTNSQSYTYSMVTEDPLAEVEVRTWPFCLMSEMLAPEGV